MMPTETGAFPIEHSDYYQFWLREKAEIEKVKWCISEELGRDCGWDYASWQWHMRHRTNWIKALRASGVHTY
jgi:hypothetical protein